MERIKVKFYRVTKYTDPTGMFRIKMELGLMGEEIMGQLTTECSDFPTIKTILGPFDPIKLMELETLLREEEKNGKIKNLEFEDEVTGIGVKIKIDSEKVHMN